ncbi:MAG: PEP-CTERM sorting domain-containing protein [Pyrinomonadaceae bacterium]
MFYRNVLALLTFLVLGFAAATPTRADVIQLFSPAQLGPAIITDLPNVPSNATGLIFTGIPVVGNAGGITVTFTAAGGQLARRDQNGPGFPNGGFLGSFPPGTELVVTDSTAGTGTGPLTIRFGVPILGFGLFAQNTITEVGAISTFTFSLFDGNTLLNTLPFTRFGPDFIGVDQAEPLFLGARAILGQQITRVVISGTSSVNDPDAQNNFAVGQVAVAIPEPATMLLLGTGLAGIAGTRWRKRRHTETE